MSNLSYDDLMELCADLERNNEAAAHLCRDLIKISVTRQLMFHDVLNAARTRIYDHLLDTRIKVANAGLLPENKESVKRLATKAQVFESVYHALGGVRLDIKDRVEHDLAKTPADLVSIEFLQTLFYLANDMIRHFHYNGHVRALYEAMKEAIGNCLEYQEKQNAVYRAEAKTCFIAWVHNVQQIYLALVAIPAPNSVRFEVDEQRILACEHILTTLLHGRTLVAMEGEPVNGNASTWGA